MVVMTDIRMSHAFIVVIYKKNTNNKKRFSVIIKECKLAKAMGKPMYALVEEGADITMLDNMPWKKMVHFNRDSEVLGIMNFIDSDIKAGGFYT